MSGSFVQHLVQITLASSAAVLLVGALRKPMRHAVGTRAAYWLWIAVPAFALAVMVPARSRMAISPTNTLLPSLTRGFSDALANASAIGTSGDFSGVAVVIWISGALLMAAWLLSRQRAFVRSLGPLSVATDGTFRSDRIASPMLLGVWRPRVIVPGDFEARYPKEDRLLMLAHERAHQERRDALVNAIASTWMCVAWFNPLMYWALGRIRFDQELACDALVLSRSETRKKRYADALLKVQMVSDSAWRLPAGCHWQSNHPLKERIAMLAIPFPSQTRRLAGVAFAVALAVAGMYTVSSSFAQAPAPSSLAPSTDKKFAVDAKDMETRKVLEMIARKGEHNILVSDKVSGRITVQLKDVTWREALDIVVQSQGLVTRQSGNMTLVDVAP
jgi:bla regulator protein blaR1